MKDNKKSGLEQAASAAHPSGIPHEQKLLDLRVDGRTPAGRGYLPATGIELRQRGPEALLCAALALPAMATNAAGNDMWTVAQNIIVDVYNHIAGISTALAGLMSAIAVIGVKLSGV